MENSNGIAQLVCAGVIALAATMGAARAEQLDAGQWKFSATFGCQSALSGQTVKTAAGDVVMTTYSCGSDTIYEAVIVADYPAGTITPDAIDGHYAGAVDGAATSAKGTIRSVAPYTLGNYTGRDVVIDVPDGALAIHARMFLVSDRLYQVLFGGPNGQESSKDCLDFLNSFTLIGVDQPPAAKPAAPQAGQPASQ